MNYTSIAYIITINEIDNKFLGYERAVKNSFDITKKEDKHRSYNESGNLRCLHGHVSNLFFTVLQQVREYENMYEN